MNKKENDIEDLYVRNFRQWLNNNRIINDF